MLLVVGAARLRFLRHPADCAVRDGPLRRLVFAEPRHLHRLPVTLGFFVLLACGWRATIERVSPNTSRRRLVRGRRHEQRQQGRWTGTRKGEEGSMGNPVWRRSNNKRYGVQGSPPAGRGRKVVRDRFPETLPGPRRSRPTTRAPVLQGSVPRTRDHHVAPSGFARSAAPDRSALHHAARRSRTLRRRSLPAAFT